MGLTEKKKKGVEFMKAYKDCEIEILYFEEEIVRTSPIGLPEDEFGDEIGGL